MLGTIRLLADLFERLRALGRFGVVVVVVVEVLALERVDRAGASGSGSVFNKLSGAKSSTNSSQGSS